jgi:GTPase SAR1 family protein
MENNKQANKFDNGYANISDNSQPADKRESYVFKFVILGDSNVGKTSILYHYIFGKCNINSKTNIIITKF